MATSATETLTIPKTESPRSPWHAPLTDNLLIQRDWRRLNHHWHRKPWVWLLFVTLLVYVAVCIVAANFFDENDDFKAYLLYYGFAAFHAFLHFFVPLHAFYLTRSANTRAEIQASLVTPIPHKHIFWWLWWRPFALASAVVLLFYFPLYVPWTWLFAVGNFEEGWSLFDPLGSGGEARKLEFHAFSESVFAILAIALLLMPWIKGKRIRVVLWTAAVLILYPYPLMGAIGNWPESSLNWIVHGTHAHFHPLVTIPYFVMSVAWSAALGVAVGLHTKLDPVRAIVLLLLFGAGAEWGVQHLVFFSNWSDLYAEWMFLYVLLMFYSFSTGALWMGIKWNLLIHLSRKPIEME